MAQQLQRVLVLGRDDGDLGIGFDRALQVAQLAVDADGKRRLGKPGADIGRDFLPRHRAVILAAGSVGKRDGNHGIRS